MVCVDFFLIGYDPNESDIMPGIDMSIADDGKSLWHWEGD